MKVPHLRNVYQKIGMFGTAGDQVRGTGLLHDGSVPTTFNFLSAGVFSLTNAEQRDLEAFMLAFPTDLAPIVGQQVTISPANFGVADVNARISLIDTRAGVAFPSAILGGTVTECDVVAKTVEGGVEKGYVRQSGGAYLPDDGGPAITEAALRAKANGAGAGQTITYTAVPPGSGVRMGVDRDEDTLLNGVETNTGTFLGPNDTGTDPARADTDGDGFEDGDEVAAGTDPTNPASFPGSLCGNGALDAGEECDDGNLASGDGCSDACTNEFCGDGIVQAGLGEICDDGNTAPGDGCGPTCLPEAAVPTLGDRGVLGLVLLLVVAGSLLVRRRRAS